MLKTKSKSLIKTVKRGTQIQKEGDKVLQIYVVRKGLLRSYTIDEKGKNHTYMFAPEGWIVSDVEAQIYNKRTKFYIDCLEDSELEIINISQNNTFFEVSNDSDKTAQINSLLKRVAVLQRRVIMLLSASAKERYLDFLDTYPNISQRVPQKMIASYLGITPEALSKIKSDVVKSDD